MTALVQDSICHGSDAFHETNHQLLKRPLSPPLSARSLAGTEIHAPFAQQTRSRLVMMTSASSCRPRSRWLPDNQTPSRNPMTK